jgi:hypothetical protein
MLATAALTFIATSFIKAPYGRYSTDKGWGPLLDPRLAWILMESPNLWMTLLMLRIGVTNQSIQITRDSIPNAILLLFF